MRIRRLSQFAGGFTMIEIAIAVGVIGFAMVAIIGILPTGMNAQKDNREDTIIAQDAPYFINAIRNGEMRTNNCVLTNFVEEIIITNISGNTTTPFYYYNQAFNSGYANNDLSNDLAIIGLLSTPECDPRLPNETNQVTAIVRAMSGSPLQQQGANSITAFRYQLTAEVAPWNYYTFNEYVENTNSPNLAYAANRMTYLGTSLRELRLKFAWPVHLLPNGNIQSIGNGRQTYRTLISSHLTNYYNDGVHWFFQPGIYTTNLN